MDPNMHQPAQQSQTEAQPVVSSPVSNPSIDDPSPKSLNTVVLFLVGAVCVMLFLAGVYWLGMRQMATVRQSVKQSGITVVPTGAQSVTRMPTAVPVEVSKDFWRTDTSSFSAQELTVLQQHIVQSGEPKNGKFVVIGAKRAGDWGMLTIATLLSATNQLSQTTPAVALIHKDATGTWTLTYQGTSGYCSQLQLAMQPLGVNQTDYNYYCN